MNKTVNATRCHMAVNAILSFNDEDKWGDTQEFIDIKLPVSASVNRPGYRGGQLV